TTITTANSVNSLNNTNWIFALNYTGTVFTDEGSTNIGSGKTVSISINGGAVTSTTTDANGAYTLNTPANVDDSIVIYLDGNTEKGALVSRTAGSASGMDIYQNHVNLRGTGTVSNTNFTTAYNGDTDILYTVSGGNLTFTAGIEFLVWTGRTFQPGGNVTVENIDIRGTVIPEANTVNVSGNWDFSTGATFTAGTSTVNFTGASKTIGGTASTTFYNLTLNNSSGFTINNNITVDHTLTLTSGNLTTNAYILTISSTGTVSRTSGHIVGNLQKNVAAGTGVARTFEIGDASNYTPVDLTFATVGTAGNVTATTASGDHAEIGTSGLNSSLSVNRNWTLTNSSTVFTTYNATFTFVAGDLDGGATTGNFIVRRYNSGWSSTSTGTRTATTTQALGIADMGAFAIGESGAVTTKTLSEAITASWVEGTAYLYNGTQFVIYQYNDTTDIPAWEGFFAAVKADVNILIPASASPPAVSSPMTKTLTSGRYYLLSSPLISSIGGTAKANLSTGGLVAGDNTFGGLDKWRIYKRLYSDGAYYDGSAETFLPGRGFFVKQVYGVDKDISVSGSGASGNSGYYELKLPMNGGSAKTFHQIGNPFWYSIKWSDCKFSQSMDTLFPLGKIAGALPPEKTETCFVRLELVSSDGLALDTYNRAGVILTEGGNPDFFTASELTPPAPYVSLSLTDPSNQNRGALAYDFRTAGQKSYTWNVNMGTSYTSIDAALSIKEFTHVPEGMSFTLTDKKTGESYTITSDKTIPVSLGKDAVRTFVLTATLNEKPTVIETVTPKLFGITGIAPNPFNPTTTIYYNLAVSGTAKVCIYNLNGQLVETLVNGQVTAGSHTAVWNASMYASGIYFVRLESGRLQQSRKITFVK
ncbi:MAG: T9SS type A sorting domain-containing protein, partial [Candidatus Latescibacterota bacterium]